MRTIAREGFLGERLHYDTVHNFMTRNDMASVKERYSDLSDESLLQLIREISDSFPNSSSREMVAQKSTNSNSKRPMCKTPGTI